MKSSHFCSWQFSTPYFCSWHFSTLALYKSTHPNTDLDKGPQGSLQKATPYFWPWQKATPHFCSWQFYHILLFLSWQKATPRFCSWQFYHIRLFLSWQKATSHFCSWHFYHISFLTVFHTLFLVLTLFHTCSLQKYTPLLDSFPHLFLDKSKRAPTKTITVNSSSCKTLTLTPLELHAKPWNA